MAMWTYLNYLKFLDSTSSGEATKNEVISNNGPSKSSHIIKVSDRVLQLAEELHKPIIKKLKYEEHTHLLKTNFWVLI